MQVRCISDGAEMGAPNERENKQIQGGPEVKEST
jgi:hypothetical protein